MKKLTRTLLSSLLLVLLGFFSERTLAIEPAKAQRNAPISCGEAVSTTHYPDTSFEVELRPFDRNTHLPTSMARKILDMITSVNDRVDGLVSEAEVIQLSHQIPGISGSTSFADLDFQTKQRLIQYLVNSRQVNFSTDRKIPGLRIRSILPLSWKRSVEFLGIHYLSGQVHLVDISSLIRANYIEIGSPESADYPSLFEFHFRSHLDSPSRLQDEIFTLLEGMSIDKDRLHAHVVGPIQRQRLSSPAARFGLMNAFRYFNLAAEMISIIEKNLSLKTSDPRHWDTLNDKTFSFLANCLQQFVMGHPLCPPDAFKMAYVGFHFPNKYDGTDNFGFQFRSLDKRRRSSFAPLLDASQRLLLEGNFASSEESAWLDEHPTRPDERKVFQRLWYRSATPGLAVEKMSESIRKLLAEQPRLLEILNMAAVKGYETQMLVYDWADDPLFFRQPEITRKIEMYQLEALMTILRRGNYSLTVTQQFLIHSGLFNAVKARIAQYAERKN